MKKENMIIVWIVVVLVLILSLYLFLELKKEKVNVYLFWGNGCGYCANAKNFFNNGNNENSKYYNLIDYEVWYSSENRELMEEVAEQLDTEVTGVPFIVIGDKYFSGYASSMDDGLNEAIISCYESQDCVDVVEKVK